MDLDLAALKNAQFIAKHRGEQLQREIMQRNYDVSRGIAEYCQSYKLQELKKKPRSKESRVREPVRQQSLQKVLIRRKEPSRNGKSCEVVSMTESKRVSRMEEND